MRSLNILLAGTTLLLMWEYHKETDRRLKLLSKLLLNSQYGKSIAISHYPTNLQEASTQTPLATVTIYGE